jgi:hypothetical protein
LRGLSVSPTSFAKANCAVPAIDGPMLNRSLLTPIYPASLSDCLIQTGPLSDAPLTRILFPRRLCSGRVTGVPLPKAHPTPPDQRRRHTAHNSGSVRLHGRDRQGARATSALATGRQANSRRSRRGVRELAAPTRAIEGRQLPAGRDLPQRTLPRRVMTDPIPTKKTDGFPPLKVPQ